MEACSTVFHLSWKKEFQLNSVFSWLHLAKNIFLASPCKKHGVGGAPVLLVSGRLEMFLNVHTIVLHSSESLNKVEQTKPHREVNRKPL